MKKHIIKITVLSLFAAAVVAVPGVVHAQGATANATSSDQTVTPKSKKHGVIPFHGKLGAVDTNAKTLTVGERVFQVTPETKILKDGQPATLSDGVVGEPVRGAYKKVEADKLEAVTIHFGAKGGMKPKKKSSNEN